MFLAIYCDTFKQFDQQNKESVQFLCLKVLSYILEFETIFVNRKPPTNYFVIVMRISLRYRIYIRNVSFVVFLFLTKVSNQLNCISRISK